MADPLKPGSGSTEAENADKRAEFDRKVQALGNISGFEAAPEVDALPGERRVVRAEAAMVLDDAEKQRQLEEFKDAVKDALIGSDGWKRQAMQEAVLNPARMQLREFLNQPTVHFLIAALQGLQQRYGFAKEDESFLAAFVEVFLKELNQDLRVEPGEEEEFKDFCLKRTGIIWREIFYKQEEWQRTPPPPPPPPVPPAQEPDLAAFDIAGNPWGEALKPVARVERQPVAPLLFQAGGPRDSDLPVGMPQPFRIERVVSSVKLGASAEHHEVYESGNIHAMTHIGVKAEGKKFRQEDRARVTVFKTKEGRVVTRLSIADGMGGVEDGELAADLAVDALGQPVPYLEAEKMVREELKKREAKEAGACVVSVDICGSIAQPHRRGDSRLYHFNRKGKCVWMSKDECRATQVKDYDLPLEEMELRKDAKKKDRDGVHLNVVTNDLSIAVGDKPLDLLPPRFLMPGDFLVLCSDGLSDTMDNQEIFSGLLRGTLLKDLLARMGAGLGKADNVSVIVYEMPLTQGGSRLTPQKITESLNP